jgi:hypothetical protein
MLYRAPFISPVWQMQRLITATIWQNNSLNVQVLSLRLEIWPPLSSTKKKIKH